MTQAAVAPPTFVIFTDRQVKLHFAYQRFLENQIRRAFGFVGSPIWIKNRARGLSRPPSLAPDRGHPASMTEYFFSLRRVRMINRRLSIRVLTALPMIMLFASLACAQENYEIQVYGSDTVPPRSTMVELHSNFTAKRQQDGGKTAVLPSNHAQHWEFNSPRGVVGGMTGSTDHLIIKCILGRRFSWRHGHGAKLKTSSKKIRRLKVWPLSNRFRRRPATVALPAVVMKSSGAACGNAATHPVRDNVKRRSRCIAGKNIQLVPRPMKVSTE